MAKKNLNIIGKSSNKPLPQENPGEKMTDSNTTTQEDPTTDQTVTQQTNSAPVESPVEKPTQEPAPVVVKEDASSVEQLIDIDGVTLSPAAGKLISKLRAKEDRVVTDTINSLLHYIKEMKPNRQMPEDVGARNQVNLYRAFQFLVSTHTDNFRELFATVLKIVDDTKSGPFGVFEDRYAYRFTSSMNLNKNDISAFERFMNLLLVTSNVKSRATISKQIDINKTLQYGFNDEAKQRITSFYGI